MLFFGQNTYGSVGLWFCPRPKWFDFSRDHNVPQFCRYCIFDLERSNLKDEKTTKMPNLFFDCNSVPKMV